MCLSGIRLTCAFEENTYPIFDQLQLVSNPKVLDSLYYKYNIVPFFHRILCDAMKKKIVYRIDLLGRKNTNSNIYIELYNDGTSAKSFIINQNSKE